MCERQAAQVVFSDDLDYSEASKNKLVQQYFQIEKGHSFTTSDLSPSTVLGTFKSSKPLHGVHKGGHNVSAFEKAIKRGDTDKLVFNPVLVLEAYREYELAHVIVNDIDVYEEYQKRNGENNYDCKIAYTRRFWEYGDSNGGKVVLGSSRQQMGEASHSE